MQPTGWLRHTDDPALQQLAHEKISLLKTVENDLPGVIIVHNLFDESIVYLSERGRQYLNVTLDEIRLSHKEYHQQFFNPEDVPNYAPRIIGMLQRNLVDEMVSYFQQVRPSPAHAWQWYASCTSVLCRDGQGRPLLAVTFSIPVDARHHITLKVERLMQENNFLRQNQARFAALSKREREVLRLLTLGHNSQEIARQLHISEDTAKTHRRNIRSKLKAESHYELLQFAQAFHLI